MIKKMDRSKNISKLCLLSRLILIFLAIIADILIPDHQADAFFSNILIKYFQLNNNNNHTALNYHDNHYLNPKTNVGHDDVSLTDKWISVVMKPFISWDSQYFLTIAHNGYYSNESMLAFFPFFPGLVRLVGWYLLRPISCLLSLNLSLISLISISAFIINLICFLNSGHLLYKLTMHLFNDQNMSATVVLLFAYNPASIFYTAFYTESLFTMLTLWALSLLYIGQNIFLATLLFSLSAFTRSNGKLIFFFFTIINFRIY